MNIHQSATGATTVCDKNLSHRGGQCATKTAYICGLSQSHPTGAWAPVADALTVAPSEGNPQTAVAVPEDSHLWQVNFDLYSREYPDRVWTCNHDAVGLSDPSRPRHCRIDQPAYPWLTESGR